MQTALPNFQGNVVRRGDPDYDDFSYQYASTSFQDGSMEPAAVVYVANDDDVIKAVNYARENGLAVAVRTGGHQYSGASSTSGRNIQLDMSEAYEEFEWNPDTGFLRAGVSHTLRSFNRLLHEHDIFLPYGQCSNVHLGGHVQTGGYGQMGRAFGLLGDYVTSVELITADGRKRKIDRDTSDSDEDRDLFFAVLGGSPGNYGVATHYTFRPLRDENHPNARGAKLVTLYSQDKVKQLLEIKSRMVKDQDFPADFDYCVTVISGDFSMLTDYAFPTKDQAMRRWKEDQYGDSDDKFRFPVILVFLQWANLGGAEQQYDSSFFDEVKDACGLVTFASVDHDEPTPLSKLNGTWVFDNVREFDTPYIKRTYVTRSTTLSEDGWPAYTADAIHELWKDKFDGCMLSVQIQHFGGNGSQYRLKGRDGRTSYSWREDTTVVAAMDCFYDERTCGARETAERWQATNDKQMKGPRGCFSRGEDRRVLWGSYGDRNMGVVWPCYHSEANYRRLCAIKTRVDPKGVFTPNRFCVGVGGTRAVDAVHGLRLRQRLNDQFERRCQHT